MVGAGVAGLTAARDLRAAGSQVLVLEAGDRVGGQIRTEHPWGDPVELGAEAVHLASPGVRTLLDELGLSEGAVASGPGRTWLATSSGLKRLPEGVGPSGPTRLGPVIRSGILGPIGLLRAALEPWLARHTVTDQDISVGSFVRRRFGRQVAERLVDPMLGNLHSGDIDTLSLQSATPSLAAVAASGRSLTTSRAARRSGPSVAPAAFVTWPQGLAALPSRLAEGLDLRIGWRVTEIRRAEPGAADVGPAEGTAEGGYVVVAVPAHDPTALGVEYTVDAVVLATPASVTAELVRGLDPSAAEQLAQVRFASVASVLLRYPQAVTAGNRWLVGTGIMVPAARQRLLKAATFVSSKWPHQRDREWTLIRLSAGRATDDRGGRRDRGRGRQPLAQRSDDELVRALRSDLGELTGLTAEPHDVLVHRWPGAVPQLEVGHRHRIGQARASLAATAPGVVLTGASIDGVGIAAAIASGRAAAGSLVHPRTADPDESAAGTRGW